MFGGKQNTTIPSEAAFLMKVDCSGLNAHLAEA